MRTIVLSASPTGPSARPAAGRLSVTTHGYAAAGRLTDLTHARGGVLLARYHYTLDPAGNRTHVTETVSGVTRGISYTYDALYRLTAADYSTGEYYDYQHDIVGNRVAYTLTGCVSSLGQSRCNALEGYNLCATGIHYAS